MAPQAPESTIAFVARLRAGASRLDTVPVRFGSPHYSHAVIAQDGVFRVRALALSMEKANAYRVAHGHFMPEDAERISDPTGPVVLEARTLDELITAFQGSGLRL